jgi:two-component system C4-dicarboxylate transport sensor histidine kinase DctB
MSVPVGSSIRDTRAAAPGRRAAGWLLLLAAAILIGVLGHRLAIGTAMEQAAARGQTTLRLAVSALAGYIGRFEALPPLIADNDDILALLTEPGDVGRRRVANDYLKQINSLLGSSDIYVMTVSGETLAASNHDGPTSFVGENFSYRPYFQEAAAGHRGRFFALGTTSMKRGYYFSAPVRERQRVVGVVVFKVDIDAMEQSWRGGGYEIIVTDPEGIIFMSGRPDWLYRGLLPLTPARLARTAASRRYAETPLMSLDVARGAEPGLSMVTIRDGAGANEYVELAETMPEAGWTVSVLVDTASARAQALTATAVALLVFGLAVLGGYIILQRRARLQERMDMQRGARALLERRVEERTADLEIVNRRLETEVAERRAAEQQLRQTQADLIQAGKLAALGQMSAALSHELNQPLGAVKTYADNAAILIDRNRVAEARDNVARISSLADRMAAISRHLRNFARKPNEKLGAVRVVEVVEAAREIVGSRLRAAEASLDIDVPPDLSVQAGPVRLQQVLVNILSNAADAVEPCSDRTIRLSASRIGERVRIGVRDNGPGVPPAIAERIFDPFFSTKGVGAGLGLGLSISYNIVKDFGGTLTMENQAGGGAAFIIDLAAASSLKEAAE